VQKFVPKIRKRWPLSVKVKEMEDFISGMGLNTVCEEASCPNKGECFAKNRVTFLILGSVCTRSCLFCGVSKGRPARIDAEEPQRISQAIETLGLKEAVITSVTRDDLADGGASHFREVVKTIKALNNDVAVEVLTPDFKGELSSIETVLKSSPDVFSHNVETVPRLYPEIRPEAQYLRSLRVLEFSSSFPNIKTKSGLMVGMGEEVKEVEEVMAALKKSGCDIITIGQYLRPGVKEVEVKEYIPEKVFKHYEEVGKDLGFDEVYSSTFVRSSYRY